MPGAGDACTRNGARTPLRGLVDDHMQQQVKDGHRVRRLCMNDRAVREAPGITLGISMPSHHVKRKLPQIMAQRLKPQIVFRGRKPEYILATPQNRASTRGKHSMYIQSDAPPLSTHGAGVDRGGRLEWISQYDCSILRMSTNMSRSGVWLFTHDGLRYCLDSITPR